MSDPIASLCQRLHNMNKSSSNLRPKNIQKFLKNDQEEIIQ